MRTAITNCRSTTLLTRDRVAQYCAALLVYQMVAIGLWAAGCWVYRVHGVPPLGVDFRVFWSTSFLSLHNGADVAFNQSLLDTVERSIAPPNFGPWIYPPTFQMVIYPVALLPFPVSYAVFACISVLAGVLTCKLALKADSVPWLSVAAFPGVWICLVYGQNSLITLALAAGALGLLDRRPALAGVCAGMLVIKPQLAVVFPLLFLCGRHYRAFGAAAVTAVLFCAAATTAFGLQQWLRFAEAASWFQSQVFTSNVGNLWNAMPTVLAISLRYGFDLRLAYAMHLAVALCALIVTIRIWLREPISQLGNASAVVTAILIQPYLVYYDLAWLLIPIICLYNDFRRRGGGALWQYALIALAWAILLPSFLKILYFPNLPCGAFLLPILFGLLVLIALRARVKPNNVASYPGHTMRGVT
ncbi:glycosyltransferase family 87 protein [Paraburkholderia sp. JHI2823]|uniref:glycosyltransferase family 87 protein n=1 Tax=Paraburkholderia sp. JHI2823 TaxID=3112960 RepID=UPI00316F943F